VAELVPATGEYLRQILDDTFPRWHDGLDRERYAKFWDAQLLTPWGSRHLDRVAIIEDGRAVSSAKRYDLSARIDGRIRRVLGIGAVFTSPARRGRGYAARLIEMLIEWGAPWRERHERLAGAPSAQRLHPADGADGENAQGGKGGELLIERHPVSPLREGA
jgi:GNAT superfamily N-acetyltransferase